jgi:hypothetical protein
MGGDYRKDRMKPPRIMNGSLLIARITMDKKKKKTHQKMTRSKNANQQTANEWSWYPSHLTNSHEIHISTVGDTEMENTKRGKPPVALCSNPI